MIVAYNVSKKEYNLIFIILLSKSLRKKRMVYIYIIQYMFTCPVYSLWEEFFHYPSEI